MIGFLISIDLNSMKMQTMARETTKEGVFLLFHLLEIEPQRMMFMHFWIYMESLLNCRMRVRVLGITDGEAKAIVPCYL